MHTLYLSCPVSYNKSYAYGITIIIIIMIVDSPVDLYLLSSLTISSVIILLSTYDNHVDYSILDLLNCKNYYKAFVRAAYSPSNDEFFLKNMPRATESCQLN